MILHQIFASKPQAMTLEVLARLVGAQLRGDPTLSIQGAGSLQNAKLGEITFLAGPKYRAHLPHTQASAVVVRLEDAKDCQKSMLICADPKLIFAKVLNLLYPRQQIKTQWHPSLIQGKDCQINPQSYIGPHCVLGERVKIGPQVILQAACYIGDDCEIGEGSVLYPHVNLYQGSKIGKNCILHAGCVIGSDGFGFVKNQHNWCKIPQIGNVQIGDRVEIGANTTIDRGALDDTLIGNDVILDNLIQIGHNVKIGDGSAIAACSAIAGSTVIGKHCLIGGGSKINGHIEITDQVHLVGGTHVAQSILQAGVYASTLTANPVKSWKKNLVRFHQLDNLTTRLIALERKLKSQEA